jgi:GT2 family glycosyltransferase
MTVRKTKLPAVTVGILNYNGKSVLPATLNSVLSLDYPEYEIVVVDNNSTDGSREWLSEWESGECPLFRCIFLDENIGSAGGRSLILHEANNEYVFLVDNDIIVNSDTLLRLMEVMQKVPGAAACHPEICDPQDPAVYHYNGGWMHYLGVYISRKKPSDKVSRPEYEIFDITSGGALLVNRQIALDLGAFDEDFFFNMEDGDFTARITLAGYLCVNVPRATVYHNSKPRGASKVFYQVRNRLFFMGKLYSLRTLILTAPVLLAFEILQATFLVIKGAGKEYLKGNLAFLTSLPAVIQKRKNFQKIKRLRDRDWLRSGEIYVPEAFVKEAAVKKVLYSLDIFFALFWRFVRRFC